VVDEVDFGTFYPRRMRGFLRSDTFYAVLAIPTGTFLLGLLFWHVDGMDPMWAVTSFVLVYDPDMRTALSVGLQRLAYTLLGVVISILFLSIFGLHKWLLPASLAFAVFICGACLGFRNAWRAVLITVCLIVGSALMEPAEAGSHIALTRALEVSVGSFVAIMLSWGVARIRARRETLS